MSQYHHIANYERVLGTSLELRITARTHADAERAEERALNEIERLEGIFSIYQEHSELRRWLETRQTDVAVSPELFSVLSAAESWRLATGGAFHPAADALKALWAGAEATGTPPDEQQFSALMADLAHPIAVFYRRRSTALRTTSLPLSLNAIAKGFIVDRACATCYETDGIYAAVVNIGGDVRHSGAGFQCTHIADPFLPAENARPISTIRLENRAVATSGNYRRGFSVGGRLHSHLIDPRTGRPADRVVSASVTADSAATADALASACCILAPEESLTLAESVPGTGIFLVAADGTITTNGRWRAEMLPAITC